MCLMTFDPSAETHTEKMNDIPLLYVSLFLPQENNSKFRNMAHTHIIHLHPDNKEMMSSTELDADWQY